MYSGLYSGINVTDGDPKDCNVSLSSCYVTKGIARFKAAKRLAEAPPTDLELTHYLQ